MPDYERGGKVSSGLTPYTFFPVFEGVGEVEEEDDDDGEEFDGEDVPRPGAEHVNQAGGFGFVGDEEVVATDELVEDEDEGHVEVRPDEHPFGGSPGGAEAFDDHHVQGGDNDQGMGDVGLEVAKVGETINAHVGSEQGLRGSSEAEEVHEVGDFTVVGEEHVRAEPDHHTAQVEGEHGLERPASVDDVPGVVGEFVEDEDGREGVANPLPAGGGGNLREVENACEEGEAYKEGDDVRRSEKLEGFAGVVGGEVSVHKRLSTIQYLALGIWGYSEILVCNLVPF